MINVTITPLDDLPTEIPHILTDRLRANHDICARYDGEAWTLFIEDDAADDLTRDVERAFAGALATAMIDFIGDNTGFSRKIINTKGVDTYGLQTTR